MTPQRRAVVLYPPPPDVHREKHLELCLKHATAARYRLTAMTSDPRAVVDMARADLVDVVLSATRWKGAHLDEVEPVLAGLGVKLDVIRVEAHRRRVSVDPVAVRLLGMGLTAEQVATALDTPLQQVLEVLAEFRPDLQRPDGPRRPHQMKNVVDIAAARGRRSARPAEPINGSRPAAAREG